MKHSPVLPRLLLVALALVACRCKGSPGECSGSATLSGEVIDAATGNPIINALAAIEVGGLDVANPEPTIGNPSYTYGEQTDTHGKISVTLPCGYYGVHGYATGYHCQGEAVANGNNFSLALTAIGPSDTTPNIAAVTINPPHPAAGLKFTVTAHISAASVSDPLSTQVLIINTALNLSQAMDPPAPASAGASPDGTYSTTLTTPTVLGQYTYYIVAASRAGLVGQATFTLVSQ